MSQAAAQISYVTGIHATGITVTSSNGHGGIGWFQGISLLKSINEDARLTYNDVSLLDTTVQIVAKQDFDNLNLELQDANGKATGKITTHGVGFDALYNAKGYYSTV